MIFEFIQRQRALARLTCLVLAGLWAPLVSHAAFMRVVCTAKPTAAQASYNVPVLEKICEGHGTALEVCTSFKLELVDQNARLSELETTIPKENGVLVFKPVGIASFNELVADVAQRRLFLSFIDNSGSPTRAEEAFLALDASLKPLGPLMNYTEANEFVQSRGATLVPETLDCIPAKASVTVAPVTKETPTSQPVAASQQSATQASTNDRSGPPSFKPLLVSGIAGLIAGVVLMTIALLRGRSNWRIGGVVTGLILATGSVFALLSAFGGPSAPVSIREAGAPSAQTKGENVPSQVEVAYRITGAARTATMVQGIVLCSDPELIMKLTVQEAASPNGAHTLPDECTVTSQEYKVAILRKLKLRGIEIAQVEFSDNQSKPAYTRVARDARTALGNEQRPKAASPQAGAFLHAGGWICNTHYEASGNARLLSVGAMVGFKGCTQVGDDVPVNVLSRTFFNGFDVVQVGNAGGVGWVWAEQLK